MTTASQLLPCPNFINGEWTTPEVASFTPVFNPSTGEQISATPMCGPDLVDQAVQAAADAFEGWWQTPPVERIRILFRYKMLLEDAFEELARSVTREHGKTLQEARGDVRRGIEVVEYACAVTELLKGEVLENVARGIDCEMVRQPVGVCVGICPYNFPALVPMWMYPLAIACGNTFVFKPSEKVPLTGIRLVELFEQAGLPKGVMNIVHGGRECVDALLTHPKVAAISFVGSSPVAKYIHETGTKHGKRVQAAGGAKNFVVVMPDAEIPKCVDGMVDSAFGCAGQRCMAGSTAIAVGKASESFIPEMAEAARSIRVGPTDREPGGTMGAVISPEHRDRVKRIIDKGEAEGAEIVVDGRKTKVSDYPEGFYLGPTLIDKVGTEMSLHQDEVFGPVLNVVRADDLDHALHIANGCSFGNGCCIYTQSGQLAREFKHRVKAGMIGINVGIPAPMAYFPFSGWDYSFFGDLHIQGREAIYFYTRAKVTTTRWFHHAEGDIWHKDHLAKK
ncbi:MAG TPA: CoA-acylating methylmalonate-semialdehyde dehydrogenase [Kiritimatiellia bacterium]|nr:CoA-acylating methylmalonate-semialdehyde dehydrogenase [Kiritimatiellia bacterium]